MGDANLSQQLDGVQENTIECMKIAADVMDTLANGKESDPSFKANCEKFMERVAASQDIVLKLVQGHKPPIELEQTPYHALTEATIASEKAKIVQHQLEETIKELQDAVPSTEGTG